MRLQWEDVETEVVIVGSGAAGLRAAIEVRGMNRDAIVISKGPIGLGTCTVLSGGVFAAAINGLSPEEHLHRTMEAGRGINIKELIDAICKDGPERVFEIVRWGLNGEEGKGFFTVKGNPPVWGKAIVEVLLEKARSFGVRTIGNALALKIFARNGKVNGLLAYDWGRDRFLFFSCGAIVIATGGASAMYLINDNPRRMMGDGYALALRAGARLMDMEFVQFYPVGIVERGKAPFLLPAILADWGRLFNDLGEDILDKYGIHEHPVAVRARDRLSQAIWMETEERPGGEVYLDISQIPEGKWIKDPFALNTRDFLLHRYDALRRPLSIRPMAHHTMGGIMIGANGATSVPGLFAAGEAAGGIHGANRLGGNALTDALVFGRRAGHSAAEFVLEEGIGGPPKVELEASIADFLRFKGSGRRSSPAVIRNKLRTIMWEKAGVVRSEDGLRRAMEELKALDGEFQSECRAESSRQLMEKFELAGALEAARLIVEAAIVRRESRGSHFRKDYPLQDDSSWKGHIVFEWKGEGLKPDLYLTDAGTARMEKIR